MTILLIAGVLSLLLPTGAAIAEPPDAMESIIPDGDTITVSTSSDQNAKITFDAPKAGRRYILYWTSHYEDVSGGFYYGGLITVPDCGASCWQDFQTPDVSHHTEFVVDQPGLKTITLDPEGSAPGSIDLKLASVLDDVIKQITPDGDTITITTTKRGQNAAVTFDAPKAGRRYILYWTSQYEDVPGGFYYGGLITVPDCGASCWQDFKTPGISHHTEFVVDQPGLKTITLDPEEFITGSIDLKLAEVPDDVIVPIKADGATVTVETKRRGQNAQLLFDSPSAGQPYTLFWTSHYPVDPNAIAYGGLIFYPGCGWTCASYFGEEDQPQQADFTAPEAGRNVIHLDPWELAKGCIEVSLTFSTEAATLDSRAFERRTSRDDRVVTRGGCSETSPEGVSYVALGDSYASGEGNPPFIADKKCHRSRSAYPSLLKRDTGDMISQLVFVACSGATIDDLWFDGQNGEGPQVDQLTSDVDLITLTVGGNDMGFAKIATFCHFKTHCQNLIDGWDATLAEVEDDLTDLYLYLKAASPDASILVLDYPLIMPTKRAGCPPLVRRYGRDEMIWMRARTRDLNNAIERAAGAAGVHFVEVENAFAGHLLCSKNPYVNKIKLLHKEYSLHPNALGHMAMANILESAYPNQLPPNPASP